MSEALDFQAVLAFLRERLKPYGQGFTRLESLPPEGLPRAKVLEELAAFDRVESAAWREGRVSGAVYHGDEEHMAFLHRVYALHSQSNPLHADLWPSTWKMEAEVVAMTARMLKGDPEAPDPSRRVVGCVSSGGTESILLAMKTARDFGRKVLGIAEPEVICPETAHAAFDKAGEYFGIRITRIPVGPDFRADVEAAERAIGPRTVALVGSAPPYPHGIVDPIPELSELARKRGLLFHTDACLGGFLLPWAEKLGYPVTPFDFRLPGVTSLSVDTHKYGYAPKGTSVVLYRGAHLRHLQYFATTTWPGGFYFSPTFAGSRPGALSAGAWAALATLGERGYLEAARRILGTAEKIRRGIAAVPGLRVLGDPLFLIAFTADDFDVYRLLDVMGARGWNLNGLQRPPAVHLCVTLRHTDEGVAERFLEDLSAAVEEIRATPSAPSTLGPLYGMAQTVEQGEAARYLLFSCMDVLYEP